MKTIKPRRFNRPNRLAITITTAVLISGAAFYFSEFRARGVVTASVVVNKYFNSGTTADVVELLVIQNNLDMRGMIIKDFSTSMANDGGGKFTFNDVALWSSLPAGTLIVLRNDNTAADTTVGGGDFNLDVGLTNTTYFTSGGGAFDIATTEMLMIKSAGSGTAGVTGSIHVLAGGTAGTQFTATAPPKLRSTGTSGTGQFVFANNSTQSLDDYDGTDATGAATGLTFGVGNNANNTAFINSLRNPGAITVTIADVTVPEGNSGTSTASFVVRLSAPAPAGGVTFDIATQDNTATVADNDYLARSLSSQTIPEGSQTFPFDVTINGDTNVEPNESFFVNVTNITGAIIGDGQAVGTISNDDFNAIPIHTIQGNGTTSPLAGQVVTTIGIVIGVKSNGFFVQTPDANIDADPNTSEGVFVFTSSTPPASAARGNLVTVTGLVQEFIPSTDTNSPPTTEIAGSPSVSLVSTGNTLPNPITLTAADTSPSGSIQQLERFEGMRVHVDSLTAIAPTQGTVNEPSAMATSNGVFYGVITGVPRPFREPGLELPDPAPSGSPCCIPRFDANPERLRVDSDGQSGGVALDVTSNAVVTNLTGPLDYAFRAYTILPDPPPATQPQVTGNMSAIPVPVADPDEFTVGSFNMERFFDTVDDPGVSDVALTPIAFNNRLNKASLAIRNVMRMPDIIGIEEMENLSTLQAVANKVNNDAVAAAQPNPQYQAFLVEGNDVGGIDVGFLVKGSSVAVVDVTQVGKETTYTEPGGTQALLNDRPSLVLRATVILPGGPIGNHGTAIFPVTVIVNHLRSLSGVDDPTDGARVRTKRRAQAEFLANLIQTRQLANPDERIISVGDYNAFQFNDGFVDSIGTIKGIPTSPAEVVLPSPDLVNPNLIDLLDTLPPAQRYSFSFDGNAQVLDHELVNTALLPFFNRIAYARNNSDFPEAFRSDPNRPERISDHDMAVAFFKSNPVPCSYSLTPPVLPISAAGGSGSTTLIAGPTCGWLAVSNDPWILLRSESNGIGTASVSIEVRENLSETPRLGTVTIGGQTFTVSQDGVGLECSFSIAPLSQTFKTSSAGSGMVNVTTGETCGWVATSTASWITITSGSSGTGSGSTSFSVTSNPGPTRTGTIKVAGKLFVVKQRGN